MRVAQRDIHAALLDANRLCANALIRTGAIAVDRT